MPQSMHSQQDRPTYTFNELNMICQHPEKSVPTASEGSQGSESLFVCAVSPKILLLPYKCLEVKILINTTDTCPTGKVGMTFK